MLLKITMNDIAENSEFRNTTQDSTVSERKMSGSHVDDESSRQIQGIKSSTLHNIAVKSSLNIPYEITERILLLLDTWSILKCKLINKEFNNLIQTSTVLQYILACKVAGVMDNPRSSLSYGERLEALKKREDVWKTLKPLFEKRIKINHRSNATYGLMGGIVFLDNTNQKDLHYCRLPSSAQDRLRWGKVACPGPGEGQTFVEFTAAVYEHDLIINVISTDTGTTPQYSYDLVLLKFSTGEYHPLAHHPRIFLQRSHDAEPEITVLQVAGDNLALVIDNCDIDSRSSLYIFDWKTGHKRLQHTTAENEYSDLIFVSLELLLVTSLTLAHFEVWYIPSSYSNPSPVVQILALKMPALSLDYSLLDINFHGEPSPFGHSLPFSPPRPFFSSPEDSIIVTNLHLSGDRDLRYAFIMHRRALLDTIQKWASLSLLQQSADQSIWLTNKAILDQTNDSHSGSVRLGTQSKSTSVIPRQRSFPLPYGFPIFAPFQSSISYVSTDPGSLSISSRSPITLSSFRYDFAQVKWADWGPPISRWFQLNNNQAEWVMNSTGQRFAFSFPNPQDERKLMVSVADFNQYNVRRNANTITQLKRGGEDDSSNCNIIDGQKEEEPEMFDHGGMFNEEIQMGLKCVIYQAPDEYDFDRVSMDEERILGVKLNDDGGYEYIQVLYFG